MSKPTSVPGLGRFGRALICTVPGLVAPVTAATVFTAVVDPLTVVAVVVVAVGCTFTEVGTIAVVVVVSVFQNFHPASLFS